MKKSKRVVIAKDTLTILEKGSYQNRLGQFIKLEEFQQKAVNETRLYAPEELIELIKKEPSNSTKFETKFVVNNLTTLDAVRVEYKHEKRLICLNFASARNPGGGFLSGSQAQEESIARATGLYPCLLSAETYYKVNRRLNTCLYSDYIIYSPTVPVFKDEKGELLEELVTTSILTAPAVNAGAVLRNESQEQIEQIEVTMKRRMDMVLGICSHLKYETLVLGAWGCGVFKNDPSVIATMFKELLLGKYQGQFKEVVFAIYAKDERFIKPFQKAFGS